MAHATVRQVYALAAALCEQIGEEMKTPRGGGGTDRFASLIAKKLAEELE